MDTNILRSILGIFVLLGIAYLASSDRKNINWRTIIGALVLQISLEYKPPRLDKTFGSVFQGVFALKTFVNQKWVPGKVVVLKFTILSQLPDSERKAVFSCFPLPFGPRRRMGTQG